MGSRTRSQQDLIAAEMIWQAQNLDKSKPVDHIVSDVSWNTNLVEIKQNVLSSHKSIGPERPDPTANDTQVLELPKAVDDQAVGPEEMRLSPEGKDEEEAPISSNISAIGPAVGDNQARFSSRIEDAPCGLDRPGSRIFRTQSLTQNSNLPSPQTQRQRRWSVGSCRSDTQRPSLSTNQSRRRGQSISSTTTSTASSEAPPAAKVKQWCEEFCSLWTQGFLNAYWELGLLWKGVCFTQLRGCYGMARDWDKALLANIERIWQPLSDFQYVAKIYPHLSITRTRRLHPEVTAYYLSWMTPEQTEIHKQMPPNNLVEEDWASVDEARDDSCAPGAHDVFGNAYPLTTRQLFRAARICNDAEWAIVRLLDWLRKFKHCRADFVWAEEQRHYGLRRDYARRAHQASEYCSQMVKKLLETLKGSSILLCKAMGLDPARVPSCCYSLSESQELQMSGAAATEVSQVAPEQGTPKLDHSFELQKASLQIGRVALKMNLKAPFLSHRAATGISSRMLARSEELADQAMKAGERRTEAKMRCLSKKIRDVSRRTEREALPETIGLLCSVTRPATLQIRSDVYIYLHDDLSKIPLETLLDNMGSMLEPAKRPCSSQQKGPI